MTLQNPPQLLPDHSPAPLPPPIAPDHSDLSSMQEDPDSQHHPYIPGARTSPHPAEEEEPVEDRLLRALTQAGFQHQGGLASLGVKPFLGLRAARRYLI